jgi:predicted XRE-type DNA-binding protein
MCAILAAIPREQMKSKIKVTKSSGNVFSDISVPNADEHFVKAEIVLGIAARIKAKKLTQAEAAEVMGLSQPDVSKLLREGRFLGAPAKRSRMRSAGGRHSALGRPADRLLPTCVTLKAGLG